MYAQLSNGIRVFYRAAGPPDGPTVLLLHGFPTSSNQYRNLIPILAGKGYHVVAPDLPGFGFTKVPSTLDFKYTFANIAETIASFLDVVGIKKFVMYVFDYGAPTGYRLALQRPGAIIAIVTQNGNAYNDGLSSFWDPLRSYWAASGTEERQIRDVIQANVLIPEHIQDEYLVGTRDPDTIDPATYTLDWALISRPGNKDIQLDLFKDYADNVALYPRFQEYFRKSQVPLLAVWGKNDIIFPAPGAEAFQRDLPNARIELLDGGHFLVESHTAEVASIMIDFLKANGIEGKR